MFEVDNCPICNTNYNSNMGLKKAFEQEVKEEVEIVYVTCKKRGTKWIRTRKGIVWVLG